MKDAERLSAAARYLNGYINIQTIKTELEIEYTRYEKRIEKMYEDYLDGRITESFYNNKREEYRDKQKFIEEKLVNLREADEEYYLTATNILKIANRMNSKATQELKGDK